MNKDEIDLKLKKIKLLVLDIDGTMTNGDIYFGSTGEQLKQFYVKDGMGITLIKKANIKVAFLTSESSEIVIARAKKLKIDKTILGSKNKSSDLENLAKELQVNLNEIAYVGDDVNDLHAMKKVGFSACPADAIKSIKEISDMVLSFNGGAGAIRELTDMILESQGKPLTLTENW